MLSCPAALHDVEDSNVQMYVARTGTSLDNETPDVTPTLPPAPAELPNLFVELLNSTRHLRNLEWNTYNNSNEVFERAFTEAGLTIPSIRHLVLPTPPSS